MDVSKFSIEKFKGVNFGSWREGDMEDNERRTLDRVTMSASLSGDVVHHTIREKTEDESGDTVTEYVMWRFDDHPGVLRSGGSMRVVLIRQAALEEDPRTDDQEIIEERDRYSPSNSYLTLSKPESYAGVSQSQEMCKRVAIDRETSSVAHDKDAYRVKEKACKEKTVRQVSSMVGKNLAR